MQINNIIVHKIDKLPHQQATIKYSSNTLPISEPIIIEFAEALNKAYFHKKSRFYTTFKIENNYFKNHLDNYLSNRDFINFTKNILTLLKDEMEKKIQSKGGYLITMDYTPANNTNYLFIALLDNKSDFSIDDNTLEIIKQITLNINHMAMASVINITKYNNNEDNYITFLKGIREIPDYFVDFIGADKNKKRDIKELTQKWVYAIENFLDQFQIESKDEIATQLANKIKYLQDEEKIITAEIIANIVYPEDPTCFLEYIYDENKNFALPNEFESLDLKYLQKLRIISYQDRKKNFSIKFRKKDIGNIIKIKDDELIINDKEIINNIKKEINEN